MPGRLRRSRLRVEHGTAGAAGGEDRGRSEQKECQPQRRVGGAWCVLGETYRILRFLRGLRNLCRTKRRVGRPACLSPEPTNSFWRPRQQAQRWNAREGREPEWAQLVLGREKGKSGPGCARVRSHRRNSRATAGMPFSGRYRPSLVLDTERFGEVARQCRRKKLSFMRANARERAAFKAIDISAKVRLKFVLALNSSSWLLENF